MATVDVDKLSQTLMQYMSDFRCVAVSEVEAAVAKVAKDTAARIRDASPVRTGEYAASWSYRRNPNESKNYMHMVVYSKAPFYRRTHLLENGHEAWDGSFVRARPHIGKAEDQATLQLREMLSRKLRG